MKKDTENKKKVKNTKGKIDGLVKSRKRALLENSCLIITVG